MTGITDTLGLRQARENLTGARIQLQDARDAFDYQKASAEYRIIAKLNGTYGKNEEERKRNLILALGEDSEYQRALAHFRQAESAVVRAEGDLEVMQDQRRAEEWGIRLALVTALERASIPTDAEGNDESFEDAVTEGVGRKLINLTEKRRAYAEINELFGN